MVNTKWSPVRMDVGTAEGTSTKKMSEFVSEDREEITMESCGLADTWPRDTLQLLVFTVAVTNN